jgi:CubicO group peptidase (beta-lactamase class C family)
VTEQPWHVAIDKLRPDHRARLEALVREAVGTVAPAVAVSVWSAGAPWYEAYGGWVDPETREVELGYDTVFDLASLTKLFTATAFLRLANDFKVDPDDPVVKVIPEFGASGPRGVDGGQEPLSRALLPVPDDRAGWEVDPTTVTFRQLLTHTAGLAPWRAVFREAGPVPVPPDGSAGPEPVPVEARWEAGLQAISGYPFVARPGEELHYSDLGYMLLGMAAARLFKAPLPVAQQALIRDRLGLDTPTYRPLDGRRRRGGVVPTSVDDDWRGRRCWGEVEDENAAGLGGVAGHAGLFASVHDVARFGVAWLRVDPRLRMERFFKSAVKDQSRIGAGRGYGWMLQPAELLAPFGDAAYGHTGFTGTSLVVDPGRDLVVALCTNRVYAGRTHGGIEELRTKLHRAVAAIF